MKAIETEYNGIRFRSRLEAKWAVFFDAVGIKYIYEPTGYILNDGTKYLPDFYLPDYHILAEVKGPLSSYTKDIERIGKFVSENCPVFGCLILTDIPEAKTAEGKSVFWYPYVYFDNLRRCACITKMPIIQRVHDNAASVGYATNVSEILKAELSYWLTDADYKNLLPVADDKILCREAYILRYVDIIDTDILDKGYMKARRFRFEPKYDAES